MRQEKTKGVWLALIAILLHAGSVFAQRDDWGLWTTLSIEKKLTQRWESRLEGEYRLNNDFTQTDMLRGSIDVSYRPFTFLKLATGYDLLANKKPIHGSFVYHHRFKLEATGSWKIDRVTLSWRPRQQLMDGRNWSFRSRFGGQYSIPKAPVKTYAHFETFHRLFTDLEPSYFCRRFSVGLDYSLTGQHEVSLGYKRDTERLTHRHNHMNVLAAGYKFSF